MNHLNEIESEPCKVIECTSWPHAKPSQLDLVDLGISLIDFFCVSRETANDMETLVL